ncbi:NAD-dependent epimerase/dehydratase family protein [Alteromonas sp. BMJM2]|uniref:NAD-dependent epimerase/dehydratase family protein n=1 Tax=Alteromonas sp. BMJM2 TaxID=2954241 RepID=UPI0022B596DE|nr:NAD(P)-dependent oxidoreductase [Alteromonas sp. BMJM2]
MSLVVLTGATGFVGREILELLIDEGHEVLAVVRPGKAAAIIDSFDNIKTLEVDLSDIECFETKLTKALNEEKVSAFIYASGAMNGDDDEHEIQSISPLKTIIRCAKNTTCKRLIHLSSLSVYGYSALPIGAALDETTPLESELAYRDAYGRAKCKQEMLLLGAAQNDGLIITSLRLGMVYGASRIWSARLGIPFKKWLLIPNNSAQLPLAHVKTCAAAAVSSSQNNTINNEVFIPEAQDTPGAFEAINVVDDVLPSVGDYLTVAEKYQLVKPLKKVTLPTKLVQKLIKMLSLLQIASPFFYSKVPNILKLQTFDSRYKTLKFGNYRQKERLNIESTCWKQMLEKDHLNAK